MAPLFRECFWVLRYAPGSDFKRVVETVQANRTRIRIKKKKKGNKKGKKREKEKKGGKNSRDIGSAKTDIADWDVMRPNKFRSNKTFGFVTYISANLDYYRIQIRSRYGSPFIVR